MGYHNKIMKCVFGILFCWVALLSVTTVALASPALIFKDPRPGLVITANQPVPLQLELQGYTTDSQIELRIYKNSQLVGNRYYSKNRLLYRSGTTYVLAESIPCEIYNFSTGDIGYFTAHVDGAVATSNTFKIGVAKLVGIVFKAPSSGVTVTETNALQTYVQFSNLTNQEVKLTLMRGNDTLKTWLLAANQLSAVANSSDKYTTAVLPLVTLKNYGAQSGDQCQLVASVGSVTASSPVFTVGIPQTTMKFLEPQANVMLDERAAVNYQLNITNTVGIAANELLSLELWKGSTKLQETKYNVAQLTNTSNISKTLRGSVPYAALWGLNVRPNETCRFVAKLGGLEAASSTFTIAAPPVTLAFLKPLEGTRVESSGRAFFQVEVANMPEGVLTVQLRRGDQVLATLYTYNKSQLQSIPNTNKHSLSATISYQRLIELGALPGAQYRFSAKAGNVQIFSPVFSVIANQNGQTSAPVNSNSGTITVTPPR